MVTILESILDMSITVFSRFRMFCLMCVLRCILIVFLGALDPIYIYSSKCANLPWPIPPHSSASDVVER